MSNGENPVMFDLSTVRVTDARWEANEKTKTGPSDLRCIVCNRAVDPDAKGVIWLHMSEQWNAYPKGTSEEVALEFEGDMYYHPVGASCAKKIPAEYR